MAAHRRVHSTYNPRKLNWRTPGKVNADRKLMATFEQHQQQLSFRSPRPHDTWVTTVSTRDTEEAKKKRKEYHEK